MSTIISTCILYLMGWKPLDLQNKYDEHKYIVCVFSHSSYYDFFIMVLYKYKYYKELHNLRVVIKPDFFNYIGCLLKSIGGVRATNISKKNGGQTEHIVKKIQKTLSAKLLICPKGTIVRGEWRTGYYHIAKALNAPICAVGLDYEQKNIYFGDVIDYQEEEPIIKDKLYNELSNIVPLHPEQENMKIRPHNANNVSVMSNMRKIGITCFLTVIIVGTYTYIKN